MADQVFIGIAQHIAVIAELRDLRGDGADDLAQLGIAFDRRPAEFFRVQIDFGEQAIEGAGKGLVFDVTETALQGLQQFIVLCARHLRDAAPEISRVDDVVRLAPHLRLEVGHIVGIVRVPHRQRRALIVIRQLRVIRPQLASCRRLEVIRQVAQKQERQHVIAEIVGVHGAAQLIRNAPEGLAEVAALVFGHGCVQSSRRRPETRSNSRVLLVTRISPWLRAWPAIIWS